MNKFKLTKDIILLVLGLFFITGSILMIGEDILGTIFFGVVAVACFYFSKNFRNNMGNLKSLWFKVPTAIAVIIFAVGIVGVLVGNGDESSLLDNSQGNFEEANKEIEESKRELQDLLEEQESASKEQGKKQKELKGSERRTSEPTISRYEEILNDYTRKLKNECPTLSMMECAELSNEGVIKMAEYMYSSKGVEGQYTTYQKWAGKLIEVYMNEAR